MFSAFGSAIDLLMTMQSRTLRWLLLAIGLVALALEVLILITGYWPNIGSAPPGAGCRYWTGVVLVERKDLDRLNCPLHMRRSP